MIEEPEEFHCPSCHSRFGRRKEGKVYLMRPLIRTRATVVFTGGDLLIVCGACGYLLELSVGQSVNRPTEIYADRPIKRPVMG